MQKWKWKLRKQIWQDLFLKWRTFSLLLVESGRHLTTYFVEFVCRAPASTPTEDKNHLRILLCLFLSQSNYVKEQEITSPQAAVTPTQVKSMAPAPPSASITEESSKKKPEIVIAVAPYAAGGPEQISFAKGDMILVKKKTETGWWEGELQAKGKQKQTGWFPAAYVKNIAGSGQGSDSAAATPTTNNSRTASFSSGKKQEYKWKSCI